jgi:hypothetical protein
MTNLNFYCQVNMQIEAILERHGWELVERQGWFAVQDQRPEFRAAFTTNRVGKLLDTNFYVTLTQFPEVTKGLIRQIGREPMSIKSKDSAREATYWGFDTNGVAEGDLKIFYRRLADAINDLL